MRASNGKSPSTICNCNYNSNLITFSRDPVKSRVTKKKWPEIDNPHEFYHEYPPSRSRAENSDKTSEKTNEKTPDVETEGPVIGSGVQSKKGKKLDKNEKTGTSIQDNDDFDQDEELEVDL